MRATRDLRTLDQAFACFACVSSRQVSFIVVSNAETGGASSLFAPYAKRESPERVFFTRSREAQKQFGIGRLLKPNHNHSVKITTSSCCATQLDIVNMTTLNDGYLGSRNDEERSEMRYVV